MERKKVVPSKEVEQSIRVIELDLDKIDQNENSRVVYKTVDLAELMGSMKRDGLLQPVGVRELDGGRFEAIWGNRRIISAKKLGWATIPAVVHGAENESDRDFLNLVENIKRQNISVTEEGRMYQVLTARGLSVPEIVARLEVSRDRVETALDAVKHVPDDFKGRIVNRVSGNKAKGTVSASAYFAISQIRKRENLNRKQFKRLLDYAAEDRVSKDHVSQVAPLLKEGLELKDAVAKISKYDRIAINLYIPKNTRKKLEKKHGRTIADLILTFLETNDELGVVRSMSQKGRYRGAPTVLKRYGANTNPVAES